MKELILANSGVTLLDDEDYWFFRQWAWQKDLQGGYVRRHTSIKGKVFDLRLHNEIVKLHYGWEQGTDHINRIPWDNQKRNLRPASASEQAMNRGITSRSTTGHKGVSYHSRICKYQVKIGVRGERIHLGYFTDLTEAAKAYDKAAKQFHGAFAVLNFPELL